MAKTVNTAAATAPVATVTNPAEDILAIKRESAAVKDKESRGATRDYAQELINRFGLNFWRKASPNFKQWQEEKGKYDAVLTAKEHPNKSQAQKRLIDAADDICNPKAPGAPRTKLELMNRAKKESVALYKAFLKEEEKVGLDDNEKRVFSALIDYMTKGLKVDLNKLDK